MSSTAHLEVSNRSAYQKVAFLLVLAGAILCLPYFAPVELSVSRSYVAGFSNRAALLIFTLGTALFAIFTGGVIAETEANNNHLSYRILFAAMSAAGLLALARTCITHSGLPGYEAAYLINRQQLLAAGIAPYFHFEFPYGPALLYPASWIARLMHLSQVEGYDIWWVFQWIAGTSMIWGTVCAIDFPLTQRRKLFLLLFLTQVSMIPNGGSNYTPLRAYCAASLVVATHWVWRRSGSDFQFALVSVLAVGLALCVSPEQGIGLVVGLFVYFLILVRSRAKIFRWSVIVVFIVGSSFCFGTAAHFGAFVSFRAFASGGYSYPVLPSPTIFLGLFAYVMAGCVLARTLYLSRLNSVVIPLTIAGCAMLPSVFGRCDFTHICAAMPAYVVGAASIFAMPSLRRWWVPLAFVFLFCIPFLFTLPNSVWAHFRRQSLSTTSKSIHVDEVVEGDSSELRVSDLPCDRKYFSPIVTLSPSEPIRPACLDTGYYLGLQDVVGLDSIKRKLGELRERPLEPLLLHNVPLEADFAPQQTDLEGLHFEAVSPWVPKPRNLAVSYILLIDFIRTHYDPGPTVAGNRLRVWYPTQPRDNIRGPK